MINIRIQTIPIDGTLADQISATNLNKAAEDYAVEIKAQFSNRICTSHPRFTQDIIVSAVKGRKMTIEKVNFCCVDFEDSIKLGLV
jgi:hypothetical protein